jgi:peroxiredoxin
MLLVFSNGCSGEKMTEKPAPNFSLTTLKGTQVELSTLKDRPVIIYFFASW